MSLIICSCSSPKSESLKPKQNSKVEILDLEIEDSALETKTFLLSGNITIDIQFDPHLELLNFEITDSLSPSPMKVQRFSNLESEFGSNNPRLIDFNSDGLLDLLLDYGTGARGANQLYYLFIRNPETYQFVLIEESASIPNLYFNSERQVIEATYIYDGASFIDFKLENGHLIKTDGIDTWENNGLTYHQKYQFDNTGNKINVETDSIMDNLQSLYSRK